MGDAQKGSYSFKKILVKLCRATGRYEASFSSKLYATLNPTAPVIDSIILKNLRRRLPYANQGKRFERIVELHGELHKELRGYLATADGKFLVGAFDAIYPNSGITNIKKLDLVLWQAR
jgi:hypothetical protein